MKTNSQQVIVESHNANAFWSEGPRSSFLITAEATQGQAALIEAVQQRGFEPPAHSHPQTNETYHVIEGEMTFTVNGQSISASAGTSVFIERGQEHSFTVETETANTLILLTPAVIKTVN